MPTKRRGFIDSYHDSRLNHLVASTAYPSALTTAYLALYGGALPASDGSGGSEVTGTRPSITFGSLQSDASGRRYVSNSAAITTTLTNTSTSEVIGFGVCAASTGGTPIYVDALPPFNATAGASVTLPIGAIRIYAEPPTV